MSTRLDQRIVAPGLRVTVADLVAVFVDHYRPDEAMTACTSCRHRYTAAEPLCPSMAVVLPLLTRRRHEVPGAVPQWVREAIKEIKIPSPRKPRPAPAVDVELFNTAPYQVARLPRQRRTTRALA